MNQVSQRKHNSKELKVKVKKDGKKTKGQLQEYEIIFLGWFENDSVKIFSNHKEIFSECIKTHEIIGYTLEYSLTKNELEYLQISINDYKKISIYWKDGYHYLLINYNETEELIKLTYTNRKIEYL